MIKIGDTVKYCGPLMEHSGRTNGKVVNGSPLGDLIYVKWPDLNKPIKHASDAVMVMPTVQDSPSAVGQEDAVRKPSHYQVFDGLESIEVIARSMTVSEFRGFCMGNVLKYRLRAGKKSELATMEKDLNKAAFYQELFDLHKGKCYAD